LAAEVDVHLGVEHALEGGFHEAAEEAVEPVEGAGLGGQFASQLFRLRRQLGIHALISVKGEG
jgi:hypothetical protein